MRSWELSPTQILHRRATSSPCVTPPASYSSSRAAACRRRAVGRRRHRISVHHCKPFQLGGARGLPLGESVHCRRLAREPACGDMRPWPAALHSPAAGASQVAPAHLYSVVLVHHHRQIAPVRCILLLISWLVLSILPWWRPRNHCLKEQMLIYPEFLLYRSFNF
jgi:hypothetical protein